MSIANAYFYLGTCSYCGKRRVLHKDTCYPCQQKLPNFVYDGQEKKKLTKG